MTNRLHESVGLAAALALTIALAPIERAAASQPEAAPEWSSTGFAEPPPAVEPESQALRTAPEQAREQSIAEPNPPAPAIEPAPALEPIPTPMPMTPHVDSRPPRPGTGMLALGSVALSGSAMLMIAGLAGPGWFDVSRRDAAILGGLSVPLALAGTTLLITGSRANRRYRQWADRNPVTPPGSGNGLIVSGTAVTLTGIGALAASTQMAITDTTPHRSDWVLVGFAGALTTVGVVVLCKGMFTRSKYAAWERSPHLQPGPLALRGGAGLSLAGRF